MIADDAAIRRLTWLWRLAKGWLPQALGIVATVFSIVWASYANKIWTEGLWAFWTTLALLVAALAAQIFVQRPSYMKLAQLRRDAEQQSLAKSEALGHTLRLLLRKIAEHCGVDNNSDRASVYFFHEGRFVMLARYSQHPVHGEPGRRDYPTGQGAIGDAWDLGSIVVDLPPTRARWEQRLVSKHGYTQAEASALRMHSQSIAALRIEADHRAVGVVVFESTEAERVRQTTIDSAKTSMLFAALCELVGIAAKLTPRGEELTKPREVTTRARPKWNEIPRPA
jgi:hypothetical protein